MPAEIIKIWLKAFIPIDSEGSAPVPGDSSKTMLLTGPVDRCFLTDERRFSEDIDAKARMHSEIEIDLRARTLLNELHKCYETTEIDCHTSEVKCVDYADSSHMSWSNFQVSPEGAISVDLSGSTHNPCMKMAGVDVSPNLDYNGTLTIVLLDNGVSVAFKGNIETYPAFEMYAVVDGGAPQIIFQEDIVPGANLISLTGPPRRTISYQVKIDA
jgi:sulfur transfer complex TusBCD TusB component (DsrH family)